MLFTCTGRCGRCPSILILESSILIFRPIGSKRKGGGSGGGKAPSYSANSSGTLKNKRNGDAAEEAAATAPAESEAMTTRSIDDNQTSTAAEPAGAARA